MQPIVGDRSIFGLEHERHRRERKLLMPPFHRDHIPAYGQLIVTLTHQAIDTLAADIPFQARTLTQDIALEVILRVVFGLSAGPRFTQLKALIVQLTDIFLTAGFALALFQPQFQKNWNRDWRTFLQIK